MMYLVFGHNCLTLTIALCSYNQLITAQYHVINSFSCSAQTFVYCGFNHMLYFAICKPLQFISYFMAPNPIFDLRCTIIPHNRFFIIFFSNG